MDSTIDTESAVSLTEGAIQQVKSLLAAETDGSGKCLRVYVEGGGCSGKQYGLVFDERRPGDQVTEFDGVLVAVDSASAHYLRGSVVDYVDSLNGGGFKISNPNARQSCGCGKSFEA